MEFGPFMTRSPRTTAAVVSFVAASAACSSGAGLHVVSVNLSRDEAQHVVADVDVRGVEQRGGNIGPYCVSVHWMPPGTVPAQAQTRYQAELDVAFACGQDISDGDTRNLHFVSTRTDIPPDALVRVQAVIDHNFDVVDQGAPKYGVGP